MAPNNSNYTPNFHQKSNEINIHESKVSVNTTGHQSASGISFGSKPFDWKQYHKQLNAVSRIALGTNAIHSLNWFLGFCSLTWATTVILGGVVTGLRKRDYCYVSILLLLEAVRLACARFFCFSVRQHLINCSPEPTRVQLPYMNDFQNLVLVELLRTLGQCIALIVVSVSIVIPLRSLRNINYPVDPQLQPQYSSNFHSVETSLQVFYIITLSNAIIAAVGVFYARTVVYFHIGPSSHSLHIYYDKIVWNGLDKGLFKSANFDILQFAFQVQAEEYMHNKRAATVMYIYEYLILYLYNHPNDKGFEAAKVALDAEDTYVREAAANIVGWWVKLRAGANKGIEDLLLQEKLLSKLASALEHEETGRAATYSFEALAENCPDEAARVRNEAGEELANILMRRIHEAVKHQKYDKALVFIKALIHLLPSVIQEYCSSLCNGGTISTYTVSTDQLDKDVKLGLVKTLVDQVHPEGKYDSMKAEVVFGALRNLLDPATASVEHNRQMPRISLKILTLHDDLIRILKNSESKRDMAVAAKALDVIWAYPELQSLIQDRSSLVTSPDAIVDALMQRAVPERTEQSSGHDLYCRGSFLSSVLEFIVGPSPSATAQRGDHRKQYIFEDEWQYLKEYVVNNKLTGDSRFVSRTQVSTDLEPENLDLELRKIQANRELPRWLQNIKITSCAIAATMLILMVTGIVYFTDYFHA